MDYSKKLVQSPHYDARRLQTIAEKFYNRYKDKRLYENLTHETTHKTKPKEVEEILKRDFGALEEFEVLFFLLYVVYPYRNNIFHGNKGVQSWLKFKPQIEQCIEIMQTLITLEKITQNHKLQATG